uniref:RNA binding motif protein 28 n=1 Tax=Oryzias sinensis TaxID=183150 RepID=A0A8C8DMA3_9TELE
MHTQTIFVGSLPESATNERLEEIFSEIGPVKQCFVVREKGTEKCRGFGFVKYSMEEDAQRALKEIKDFDGKRLSLSLAKKKIDDKKKAGLNEENNTNCDLTYILLSNFCNHVFTFVVKKTDPAPNPAAKKVPGIKKQQLKSRLIIRNLSFKCSEDDLKEVFEKYGTVLEAKIPLKPDGKMRGFAFVLFKNVCGAAKALKEMNLKEIKGRPVAVDWAVPKDKYTASTQSSHPGNADSEHEDEDDSEDNENSEDEEGNSEDEDDHRKEEEEKDDDDDNSNDDDDDDGLNSANGDSASEDAEDDDDDDDDQSGKKYFKSMNIESRKKDLPSDVKEGRTVFIRNLSFDTDEEGLESVLLQYGELNYIKILLHPDTEHSKGCAFAQFKTKDAADRCIVAAQDEAEKGGIRVDGRKLSIVAAVSREDAVKLKVDKKKVETGSRNLYLAREGLIRSGTKAAEGVSEADMAKRTRFEEMKRAKLRDISVFVSKTRLCIHNLPKSVDNKKLKALCLQAVKGVKGVRITECRVMYDKKPERGQVVGQSLGYGFVQFQEHEQALSTLRYLNNNPDIFSSHKRPIVEFSLEDSRKLKIKEIRKQKHKVRLYQNVCCGTNTLLWLSLTLLKCLFFSPVYFYFSGNPEKQNQHGFYSGFQTKAAVEHVDLKNGKKRKKVLPLPSHRGPKIRMRDKGKQQAPPPKKAKPGSKRSNQRRLMVEKPSQLKNQKREGDRFENLVEQYKKKLLGSGNKGAAIKRNKWFDG